MHLHYLRNKDTLIKIVQTTSNAEFHGNEIEPGDTRLSEFFPVDVGGCAILIDNFNDGPIDLGRWRREKKPPSRIGRPKGR